MSFLERARERALSASHEKRGISATQMPYEMPGQVCEPLMVIGDLPSQTDEIAKKPLSGPNWFGL